MQDFDTALQDWMARAQKIVDDGYQGSPLYPQLEVDPKGKKYLRIVKRDSQATVFCFIEKATGNVLFPAGWKAPTKHSPVRGNIWTVGQEGVGQYGANYIK